VLVEDLPALIEQLKETQFERLVPAFEKMKGDVILSNRITEDDGAPEKVFDLNSDEEE
jgi:hypothetical protein